MPHIQQLDPHVADLIAAGEVVERPASVVKELMENAIDAGASHITVELQHGGMTLIRVTDDGCGIAPEEAAEAFLRHATSKLRTEYDLEAIGTLGFRGEALAAISAVSQIELLTRTAEAPLGTSVSLDGGVVVAQEEAGCPKGTTMVVRDLFFNTPARLKFMKKDAAEGAACFAAVQRTALSHPEVSVKLIRDGRQELLTPGDGQLQSAMYAILGRDMALGFIPVKGAGEEMSVSGYTSLPSCCRGTRGYQFFFVNGRYVKSRTMMAAVEEAYANQKMVGKFPGCVLHLSCKLSTVDVNVHPTKQEVKFGSEKKVFDTVYYAVKAALGADCTRPSAEAPSRSVEKKQEVSPVGKTGAPQTMTVEEYRKLAESDRTTLPLHDGTVLGRLSSPLNEWPMKLAAEKQSSPSPAAGIQQKAAENVKQERLTKAPKHQQEQLTMIEESAQTAEPPEGSTVHVTSSASETTAAEPIEEPELKGMPAPQPWRMTGEVLSTYIIVEQGEKVLFIDKHAAHERLNFDRLKAEGYQPMVQALLSPVVFTPPPEEGAALLAQLELLGRFGFEVEDFGGGSLIVRAAPADVDSGEIERTLTELGGKLLTTGRADPAAARDALLHTMACKAAIKGGQKNSQEELLKVAQAVMEGKVKYCPHGRPVAVELTQKQLEKRFGRA